jgi:type IV pilus assembly protein PilQ
MAVIVVKNVIRNNIRSLYADLMARARWILGVGVILLPVSQAHGVAIDEVEFSSLPGGRVEIVLAFDEPPPEAAGYTIESPARIVLDLEGVESSLEQKKHTLDFGNTRSVMILEGQDRTRVIINLVELAPYSVESADSNMRIVIGDQQAAGYLKQSGSQLESSFLSEQAASQIESVDFQRGQDGEGRLLISLSDPKVNVDVAREGQQIKVVFPGVGMPEDLQRKYDVIDFATPVNNFSADVVAGAATFELEPTGDYDYLAYQADDLYVVSVRPLSKEEVEAKKRDFQFTGEKLSLNFQDIPVRSVLQLIADFTDLNLVASDTVSGRVTLRLENVPWDQALDLVLKTKGLDKRQIGNVLMVAPAAEIAARERLEVETNKQLEELAPLQTELISILYAEAQEVADLLEDQGGSSGGGNRGSNRSDEGILSARGSVQVDERTNAILVTETVAKLEQIRALLTLIDIPVRQVVIESRIVVANSDFSRDLGVRWGGVNLNNSDPEKVSTILSGDIESADLVRQGINDIIGGGTDPLQLPLPGALAVDLGVATGGASSLAVNYVDDRFNLTAELSALESSGNGEVVSQPKVITGDKQQASIESGQQIAYQEASASGATAVSFQDAVLKLDVTPNITPDDRVMMELIVNQDSVGEVLANGQPTIEKLELNTTVLVNNGQTVVLGGIFQVQNAFDITKTPFLGDIPYLGRLFKRTTTRKEKAETLIFITPRIVADDLLE